MSERNELAAIISDALGDANNGNLSKYIAEAILAAGYRAPRARPAEAAIDSEAMRIVNATRYQKNRIQRLGSLSPYSQARYREMAKFNLQEDE